MEDENGATMAIDYKQEFYKDVLEHIKDGVYVLDKNRLITYWNNAAEEISDFKSDEVVGKSCSNNILRHVDYQGNQLCSKNRCPAYKTIQSGDVVETDAFLHHKDGHRMPIAIRTSPIRDKMGRITGALEIFQAASSQQQIESEIVELKKLLMIDELTNVGNRRFGEIKINDCVKQLQRYNWPFGVIFLDIDNFKNFNDQYGHSIGDRVLKMAAATLRANIRSFDHVFRWGGEEFVILCINVDSKSLYEIAEKIRALTEQSFLMVDGKKLTITISAGLTISEPTDTPKALIERADTLMYESKAAGKNRVTVGKKSNPDPSKP